MYTRYHKSNNVLNNVSILCLTKLVIDSQIENKKAINFCQHCIQQFLSFCFFFKCNITEYCVSLLELIEKKNWQSKIKSFTQKKKKQSKYY